jgi:protein-S-isoprenylcysteine O-methyltransferase Ste14
MDPNGSSTGASKRFSKEMLDLGNLIFYINTTALLILLLGVIWSIGNPERRIWPPTSEHSWQHKLTWSLFYLVFGLNALLIVLDWNTWIFQGKARFILGLPLILIGSLLFYWGIRTLGTRNTSGQASGFVSDGPYRFTRNPQYLGDMLLFAGLSIIANSLFLWVTHSLLIFVFIMTPIAEEDWLKEKYGEIYREYIKNTSRFL